MQNSNGIRPAYIAAYLAQVRADKLFGTGILGLEVRNNTIQAHIPNVKNGWVKGEGFFNYVYDEEAKGASRDAGTPGILGTVFEANKCTNAECNYTYGQGAQLTVFKDTIPDNSQEAAEANALLKYEAANPPQAVWPMPAAHQHPDSLGIHLQRSAALLHNSTRTKTPAGKCCHLWTVDHRQPVVHAIYKRIPANEISLCGYQRTEFMYWRFCRQSDRTHRAA